MRPRAHPSAPLLAAALLGSVLAAACGRSDAPPAGADSALARDLTLANGTARPALNDTVALGGDTAAVAAPTPEPAPTPVPSVPSPAPARTPSSDARASSARSSAAPRQTVTTRRAPVPAPVASAAVDAPDESRAAGPAASPAATGTVSAAVGRSLAAGTVLTGTLGQRVCTESNHPGDRLVATLGSDVSGPAGVVLPAGTPLVLEVARVAGDPPAAEFVVRGVSVGGEFVPIVADAAPVTGSTERRQVIDKASDKGKAVQGAVAGAILGQILGRSTKSTVIGAAGGAAAGAAIGRGTSHREACVASGAPVRVQLTERFTVR